MSETDQPAEPIVTPSRYRAIMFRVLLVVVFLLVLECTARLFWCNRGTSFFSAPRTIYRSFYPKVAKIERNPPLADDGCFDVLILGGSVLHLDYSDVEHVLRERLIRQTGRCVRIHNAAAPAQTTLDSLYKYRHLAAFPFDVVLVYHGINETRANNCPRSMFREDYSHLSWYRLIDAYEENAATRWFALPYTLRFVAGKVLDRMGWSHTLPTHRPSPESMDDGCDVKTGPAFEHNLRRILELAAKRAQPVVLMTFAYDLPPNYSEKLFDERKLDYTDHSFPVELWGKPDCVVKALRAHNDIVRRLSSEFDDSLFVDQEALVPKEGVYFNDICHLTHEGSEQFANNVVAKVLPLVRKQR